MQQKGSRLSPMPRRTLAKYKASKFDTFPGPRIMWIIWVHKRCVGNDFIGQSRIIFPNWNTKECQSLTPSHILSIVPTLEKGKLICSLPAQKMPAVVGVPCNQILLSYIMWKDQVSWLVIPVHIDSLPVAICKGTVLNLAKERPPNTRDVELFSPGSTSINFVFFCLLDDLTSFRR